MNFYNQIPRNMGNFFWKQVAGAIITSAKSLYIAIFDEIDEGTTIFKCVKEGNLPLNGAEKFLGIKEELAADYYYLWFAGKATDWHHGGGNYNTIKLVK